MYNKEWVIEWDKPKIYEKIVDLLDFIFTFIFVHWVIIPTWIISIYLFHYFVTSLNILYLIGSVFVWYLGIKVDSDRGLRG